MMKCKNCGSDAIVIYSDSCVCEECHKQIKGEVEMRMEELSKEVAKTFKITERDVKKLMRYVR